VTKGCPQGSCCGPGFWNFMYNALLNLEFSSHTKVIAFADDLAIMATGNTLSEAEGYANLDLAKIEKWAKENKMQFNETKSKVILLSRKRNNKYINIHLNNRRLEVVKEMKYLGIYFDSWLTFDSHIKYIAENSTKLIHMLGRSAKLHCGLGHKSLNLFASAFKWLQSTFTYNILFARHLNFSTWFTKNVNIPGTKKD